MKQFQLIEEHNREVLVNQNNNETLRNFTQHKQGTTTVLTTSNEVTNTIDHMFATYDVIYFW